MLPFCDRLEMSPSEEWDASISEKTISEVSSASAEASGRLQRHPSILFLRPSRFFHPAKRLFTPHYEICGLGYRMWRCLRLIRQQCHQSGTLQTLVPETEMNWLHINPERTHHPYSGYRNIRRSYVGGRHPDARL